MRRAQRKADGVASDLLQQIVSGRIAVGSLLPREADLAESYGVNRSVVREANKLLEVHRLVRPIKRRGTEVLDPLMSVTPAVLRAMLVDDEGRIDRQMLSEFLEIRAQLDAQMTALAAERRTPDDLEEIESCVLRIEAASGADELHVATNALGLALAHAAHNRLFVMLSHWHRQITEDLAPFLEPVRDAAAAQRGYQLLLDAIRRRDASLAGSLVREFHAWANEQMLAAAEKEEPCLD